MLRSGTTPRRYRPYRAHPAAWLRSDISRRRTCGRIRLSPLLHLARPTRRAKDICVLDLPPSQPVATPIRWVSESCDPVRLLSHLQNATASNQETVSRGRIRFFPAGFSGSFALVDTFPPLGVSVTILSVYKRLELHISDRVFCNAKTLNTENRCFTFLNAWTFGASINCHPYDIREAHLASSPTPGRGSPKSARYWPIVNRS